jgi:hypothetical protein
MVLGEKMNGKYGKKYLAKVINVNNMKLMTIISASSIDGESPSSWELKTQALATGSPPQKKKS